VKNGLSQRDRDILRFIGEHNDRHGFPPTIREIGEGVGLRSSSTVHAHLQYLEDVGQLTREPGLTRALRLAGDMTPIRRGKRLYQSLYPGADWETMGANGQQAYIDAACRYDGRPLAGSSKAAA
jgi:SOS-response transcriptional repressor LexA